VRKHAAVRRERQRPPGLEAQDAVLSGLFTSGVTAPLDDKTLTLTNDDEDMTLVLERD
jgi:hypothetical protein